MKPFDSLTRLIHPSQMPSHWNNLFNSDEYYDLFRKDIDTCCEIAIRYNLVVDVERGILKGGRNIYEDSFLNEFRVARLLENHFGKGCLKWDPPGRGERLGEFLLNVNNNQSIFVEVKTKEEKDRAIHLKFLSSKVKSITESLKSAYKKVDENINMPFLVVLSNRLFDINIDSFQIIMAYLGKITYQNGIPEVIRHGFCSTDRNKKLSAIGHYCHYVEPESQEGKEVFRIYHNPYADFPIPCDVFEKKADYQFVLSKWNGRFEQ